MDTHATGPIPPREALSSGGLVTRARPGLSGLGGQRRHDQQARHGGGVSGQRGNKWWTLAAVCLGTFMLLLDITIVNVALPDIQRP